MTDLAISITSEDDDEEAGEDLGGLDDLLASLKAEDEAAPNSPHPSLIQGTQIRLPCNEISCKAVVLVQ